MNLRKRFVSALLGMALLCVFTACEKSDDTITVVDIKTDVTEAQVPLEGGSVTVNVTSNVDWIVEMYVNNAAEGENEAWVRERVTVTPEAGTASSMTPVKISVVKNTDGYEREFVVKFRPTNVDSPYAPVKIFQSGDKSRSTRISIADARKMYQDSGEDKLTVTESVKIGGIVVSSRDPQTVSEGNLMIQDGTGKHSGIIIYSKSIWGLCNFGDSVEVELKGGVLETYYGLTQYKPTGDAQFKLLKEKAAPSPEYAEVTGAEFMSGDYESQYVKIVAAQVIDADLTKTMKDSPKVETEDKNVFLMYSRSNAPWADQTVPQGAGPLIGLCGSYSNVWQLVPSVADGFAGMTGERFSGAPTVKTGDATEVTGSSAVLAGSYTYAGEETISAVGIAMKAADAETYEYYDAETIANEFTVTVTGLTDGTTYNYYAYVKIGEEEYKGTEKTFLASDEEVVTTVAELVAALRDGVESGASMASYGTLEGIIAAVNGEGGNYYSKASLVDGNGEKLSGIILYNPAFNELAVGDKIRLNLSNAVYDLYNGLRELKWNGEDTPNFEVVSSGNEFVIPELTLAEALTDEYQAMRVTLKDVYTTEEAGATWYSGDASAYNVNFSDGDNTIQVRTTKYATWKDELIATDVTANLTGVLEIYKEAVQIYPIDRADIASFLGEPMPQVTTGDAVDVTSDSATLKGAYSYEGSETIKAVGFEYKVSTAEQYEQQTVEVAEEFELTLTDLIPESTYAYRAYVLMGDEVFYGAEKYFTLEGAPEITLTASELNAILKTLDDGALLAAHGTYVEGIVAANNDEENLNRGLSVVDGTGEPNSGIYLYNNALNGAFAIGDRVKIKLANAKLTIYNGLREICWDAYDNEIEVLSSDNTFVTPEITAAQLNSDDYQGMLVTVVGLNSDNAEGTTWVKDGKTTNTYFVDANGDKVVVRTSSYVAWADEQIATNVEGNITGVAQVYNSTVQLFPNSAAHIADFAKVLSLSLNGFDNLTSESVTLLGSYSYEGEGTVSEVGVAYRETAAADAAYTQVAAADLSNEFSVNVEGLAAATSYDFVAYIVIDGVAQYSADVYSVTTPQKEEVILTVSGLVAELKNLEKGASLAALGTYVEGIVVGTNADENLYKGLAVADGTGEPNSAIFLYNTTEFHAFQVGDKVRISLLTPTYDIYNGLRQLKFASYNNDVELISSGNTTVTPQITVDQLLSDEYQSLNVEVVDVKAAASAVGTTWSGNKTFTDASGSQEFTVTTYKNCSWAEEFISDQTGSITGIAYGPTTLKPQVRADISEALFGEEPQVEAPVISGTAGNGVYTSNVELPKTSPNAADGTYYIETIKCDGTDTAYTSMKIGKSKGAGSYSIKPGLTGDYTLTFYAVAWKDKATTANVNMIGEGTVNGATSAVLDLQTNVGASNSAPYTVTFGDADFYTLTIKGATADTMIQFSTEGCANYRVVFTGINAN